MRRSLVLLIAFLASAAFAHAATGGSISDTEFSLPAWGDVMQVLSLRDYNTRIVVAGATALGAAGGLIGTFLLLRKRSLLSDTVSHATLPGIALAFIIVEAAGGNGKSLPVLLLGAVISGLVGMGCVLAIRRFSRVKDDAALAIVLSVFFGLGISLTVTIQQMPTGNAAGIANFIYGKAASMTAQDAWLIFWMSLIIAVTCIAMLKEFTLLCFDQDFASAKGFPVIAVDVILMGLVVAVVVIGLSAVGLLLVVAMLIVPPAAARFWSDRLAANAALSTGIGAVSGLTGVIASALLPKLPAGAVIVIAASAVFFISMIFGGRRGVVTRALRHHRTVIQVGHQHLMRAFYERLEADCPPGANVSYCIQEGRVHFDQLLISQPWRAGFLRRMLRRTMQAGWVREHPDDRFSLTASGRVEARKVVRNHRLWELYLIQYADIAPSQVHHDADQIEHVVDPQILGKLEELLNAQYGTGLVPANPELGMA